MITVEFWTTLIKITRKPTTPEAQRSLDLNCTHVTGPYYIMEGDTDCLRDDGLRFREIEQGAVGALGGLSEDELKAVCLESYGVEL